MRIIPNHNEILVWLYLHGQWQREGWSRDPLKKKIKHKHHIEKKFNSKKETLILCMKKK